MSLYPSLEELTNDNDSTALVVPKSSQLLSLPQLIKCTTPTKLCLKDTKFLAYKTGIFIKRTPSVSLHVGDQVLSINGISVAGLKERDVTSLAARIDGSPDVAIKNRPYAKLHQLTKDKVTGTVGVVLKNKKITSIVQDSSCARNGVLIHHYIVEVNGINVIDLTNNELISLIKQQPNDTVNIVVYPDDFYKQLKV